METIAHIHKIAEDLMSVSLKNLGIYDDLYNNPNVTEVMINTNKKIFTKNLGVGFIKKDEESKNDDVENLLKVLSSLDTKELTKDNPSISAKLILSTGEIVRVEGVIPPIVANPSLNLRKQNLFLKSLESYLKDGFINKDVYDFLKKSVEDHRNIIIIGGTDTGKTTFTNAIIDVMQKQQQRLIIIEEVPELKVNSDNVNKIQIIPKVFSSQEALKYCMRASPERIIFGEIRDGYSAYEFINGLNSGHPGGVSTIHADDGLGGLKKLETYINSAYGKPMSEEIGMTIDVLVVLKMKNYKRYLASIDVCEGFNSFESKYILKNIYNGEKSSEKLNKKSEILNYLKKTNKFDDFQLKLLESKDINYLEEFVLKRWI